MASDHISPDDLWPEQEFLTSIVRATVLAVESSIPTSHHWANPRRSSNLASETHEVLHSLRRPTGDGWGKEELKSSYSRMYLTILNALEAVRGIGILLQDEQPPVPAVAAAARSSIEISGLTQWLAEHNVGARQRIARAFSWRLKGAGFLRESVVQNHGTDVDPGLYGETKAAVILQLEALGLSVTQGGWCDGAVMPSYTARAKNFLIGEPGYYTMSSGAVHGEQYAMLQWIDTATATSGRRQLTVAVGPANLTPHIVYGCMGPLFGVVYLRELYGLPTEKLGNLVHTILDAGDELRQLYNP